MTRRNETEDPQAEILTAPILMALPARNWRWILTRGILLLLLGAAALLFPVGAVFAFAIILAAYAFADGIASLFAGIAGARSKEDRWWALILMGMLEIVIAVAFVIAPFVFALSFALATLFLFILWSFVRGALELIAAIRLRRAIKGEWMLGLSGLLSIALGAGLTAIAVLYPGTTPLTVGWLIGIYALFTGGILIALALRLRRKQNSEKGSQETGETTDV